MVKPGYKQTEIGVIPENWIVRRLSECTKRVSVGLATSVTQYYREDGVPIFRNLNIKPGYLDDSDILYLDPDFANHQESKKIRTGDVLTVHTGYVGISCVVPAKYNNALTFTTLITTTDSSLLLPEFLSIYLNSSFGALEIESLQAGGGRNNLNVNDFVNFRIPLPSIDEQHKIVEYLKEIDRYLELTNQQLAKKKAIKQGAMQELLTGKKRLPGFSGEWQHSCLGESAELSTTTISSKLIDSRYYVGTDNMVADRGGVKDNELSLTYANVREYKAGDILLSNIRPYLKKIWYATRDGGCSNDVLVIRRKESEELDSRLLYYILATDEFFDEIMAYAVGTKMPRGDKSVIKSYKICFPKDISEQQAIAEILSNMDSEIEALEQKLEKYRQVRQGMMQQLLTDKIRLV